jgi:hypothetical protein
MDHYKTILASDEITFQGEKHEKVTECMQTAATCAA